MKRKHRHTSRSILAFILVLVMMFDMIPFTSLTMEVKATEDDYVITEVPVVDRGQQNNWAATENYDSLVDGDTSTKYGLSNAEPYVEFHYSSAFVPKGYILWTGNDCSERSPESWVIKAMNQGDEEWTILDSVDNTDCGQLPNTISISKTFSIENTSAYQYYRFEAVRNSGSHGFELAEIQFIVDNTDLGACSASGLNQFYKYNGGAAIAVSYEIHAVDGTVLTNSDYTAEFRNAENQKVNTINAAGKYSLVITGKGSYSGTRSFSFKVLDFLPGSGTEESPYIIASEDDWIQFADEENSDVYRADDVYIKLNADISTSVMAGSETNRFKGTFDGAGHTITINYTAAQDVCAPFRYAEDAEIKDLTIDGTINNQGKQNAGVVGFSYGTTNISYCVVNASITCGYSGDSSNGGIVADSKDGSLTISNCAFYGSLKGNSSSHNGGLLGWRSGESTVSFQNCFFSPAELSTRSSGNATFGRNYSSGTSFSNCYYTQVFGTAQGTQTSTSGEELAVLLGAAWDVVNEKVVPVLNPKNLNIAVLSGIREIYKYTGKAIEISYSIKDVQGHLVTADKYSVEIRNKNNQTVNAVIGKGSYTLIINGVGEYTGSISAGFEVTDQILAGNGTFESPYIISEDYEWGLFTDESNHEIYWGEGTYVNLHGDIGSQEPVTDMVGTDDHPYKGIFNGAGYTLNVEISSDQQGGAPFHRVNNATIKNLITTGSVTLTSGGAYYSSGLVGFADGVFISNCQVSAAIKYPTDDRTNNVKVCTAGVIGNALSAPFTINNCLFDGEIIGSGRMGNLAGLVGWDDGSKPLITNCLNNGTFCQPRDTVRIARVGGRGQISNCYYTISGLNGTSSSVLVNYDYRGEYTNSTGETLRAMLGDGWEVKDDKVVPIMGQKNLATAEITGMDLYQYTGEAVDLSYGLYDPVGTELTEGVDYSVEIRNANDQIVTELREIGYYYICFTGIGEYSGSVTKEYVVFNGSEGLSVDTDYRMDETGFYYVNMPVTGDKTLALTNTNIAIKVYDDGGKNNNYSSYCNGYLKLTAPDGYIIKISGKVQTESSCDYLKIYDGNSNSAAEILKAHSSSYGTNTTITETTSSDRNVTLYFYSDRRDNYQGLDLVVSLIDVSNTYKVRFNANGGTGDSMDDQQFLIGETKELSECTYTAPEGYRFGGWALSADGEAVYADGEEVCDLATTKDANVELFAKWEIQHEHDFTYSVDGATITATCTGTTGNCELENGRASLTVRKPQHTAYGDGKAKAATLEGDTDILGTPTIRYKKGSTGLGDAPLAAGNYTASFTLGNRTASIDYTIDTKPVTITGLSAENKTYDGTTAATVGGTAVLDGKLDADDVGISAGTASFATAAPGTGISVSFTGYTLSGEDAANYTLSAQPAAVTAAINKRSLTITASDQTINVGDAIDDSLDQVSITAGDGLVEGHVISEITLTKVNEENSIGTYIGAIAVSNARIMDGATDVSGNYQINYENGDLKIGSSIQAQITELPVPATGLEYNGTEQALLTAGAVANSGAVQYKLDNGNWTDTIPAVKNAGTYTVSYRAKGNGYYIAGNVLSTSISIAKKAVSITGLSVENKTYDGTTDASVKGTAVTDGKIENDDLTVSAGTASFATAAPGTGISVSFTGYTLSGEDAANYTLSAQPAAVTASINKRSLTITASDQQTSVNGNIATGTDKISVTGGDGLLDGDEITGITLARVDEDNTVGTHTDAIAASGAVIKRGTTDVSEYYRISYENGDLEIIDYRIAEITSQPTAATGLVYNGTVQALLTAGAVANSGAVQYKLDNGNWIDTIPAVKNAGTYTVSYRAKANAGYLEGSVSSYSITIAKAPLTVTANKKTITYGDEPSNAGVSYSGFVGGETEAVLGGTLTYEYDYKQYDPIYEGENWKIYSITPGGLRSDNYDITYTASRLTIVKKPVEVVWSDTVLTYNGHNQGPVPTLTGLVNNDEVVVNAEGVKRYPGTYIATPVLYNEKENYIIVDRFPCSFIIKKAPSPVEIDGEASVAKSGKSIDLSDKVTMNKASGEVSYAINGDAKGCRLEGSTFISGSSTGTVSVNVAVAEDRCYEAMEAGTIYVKVCDKAQNIAFEEAEVNKTYGDADFTNVLKGAKTEVKYEVTEGSEVASVDENGKLTIKAAGTAVITATAEEDSVYAGAVASYTLTVARKVVTVKAEDKGKKEGEQDPVFTAVIEGLVNGDDESMISYSISREEGELEGSYVIIPSGDEEQGNYSVSYRNAVLTIESVIVEGRKYTINILTGAVAKNKEGEPVYTANENERISISWTPREGYEFVQWKISGAAAEEAVSANTAFRMGAGDVTVSYEERLKAAAEVTEEKPAIDESVTVRKVKFAEKKLTLIKQGGIKENKATAEGDANAKIVYVTGNKDIVAVDQSGRFYPVGVGETTVTAYCGNKAASCKVTVVSYTKDLIIRDENNDYINDQPVEMKSGEQKFLTVSFEPYDSTDPRTVSWKSDNKKVRVKNGLVTAGEVNEVTEVKLTAEVKTADPENNAKLISRTVNIRLIPLMAEKESAAEKSHTLKLKKTLKLNVTDNKTSELKLTLNARGDTDIAAVKVVAESSNPSVVSVNALTEGGTEGNKRNVAVRLEAGKAGTAYIIVKTYSPGSSEPNVKRCKVSVTKPASAIVVKSGTLNVSYKKIEMRKGQNGTIEVSLDPAFSTDAGKLKLSGSGGVKLKNGIIYAVKAKDGKITVKCGKLKEVITVTVKE